MKSSKLFITSLLAAAAMGTSAYATSLTDATLFIDSFDTETINSITDLGWNLSGISGSDTGIYTSTSTQATISAGTSGASLTTNVPNGNINRYTYSAIFTVDASVFSSSNSNAVLLAGTNNGTTGAALKNGGLAGVWENAVWGNNNANTPIAIDSNYAVNGLITIGISFDNDGTKLYVYGKDGVTTYSGLKGSGNITSIGLAKTLAGVQYSNLYWFNTKLETPDMTSAMSIVATGTDTSSYFWAGTGENNAWNTTLTNTNWTLSGNASAFENGGNVYFGSDAALAKTVAIDSDVTAGTISVADNYTFVVGTDGSLAATSISVAMGHTATLNLADAMTLNANLTGSGVVKKTGTGVLTYSGTISSGATLEIADGGTTDAPNVFSGTLSSGGNIVVSGGTLSVGTTFALAASASVSTSGTGVLSGTITITSMGANSSLTLAGTPGASPVTISGAVAAGSTISVSGGNNVNLTTETGQALKGSLTIGAGSTVTVGNTNEIFARENVTNKITLNGGTLNLGTSRQTFGTGTTFELNGGLISAGNTTGDNFGSLDLKGERRINVSADSEISASIRLRGNTEFNVSGGTLTLSGILDPRGDASKDTDGKINKTGSGNMIVSGASSNYNGGFDVNGGKLIVQSANALGTGAVTVNGTGSILDINLSSGTLTQGASQALTTTGAGKITVSAGRLELTGAVNLSNAIEVANGASVTTTSGVKFALGGLTGTAGESGTTFKLFTLAEGSSLTWAEGLGMSNVNLEGSSVIGRGAGGATFNADGTVTVSDGTAGELTWVGDSAGAGTWNYSTTNTPWTNSGTATSFMNKDNVTFAKDATVAVDAAGVTAGKVTIASDKTVTLTGGNVTVSDSIELETGATLSLGAGSANGATATLAGNSVYAITASASGEVALGNVSGTGTLKFAGVGNLSDSGGSDPAFSTVAIGSGFAGTVEITAGLVDMLTDEMTSAILPSRLGSASKVVLNGGGLLFRNTNNTNSEEIETYTEASFSKAIEVGTAGGVIRLYGNGNVTLASDISGTGTLKHTDGGTLTLVGTVNLTGGFTNAAGTTNFTGTTTLGTLSVSGGTLNATSLLVSAGEATANGIIAAGSVTISGGTTNISGGTTVGNGGVLTISSGGGNSALRGGVTVQDGGMLKLTANDATGYTNGIGNITIDHGGVLEMAMNGNTSFRGTLTLNGTIRAGTGSGANTRWDFYTGSSLVTTVAGAKIESGVNVSLRRNDVEFAVNGKDASLEIASVIVRTEGNGILKKAGTGTLILSGTNTHSGVTISGGVLVAKNTSALGASTATTTVDSGGVLKIAVNGGVTAGTVTLNDGALFAIDLTTMTVAEDTALTIISSSAILFNSISAGGMSSNDIEAYFSASNSNLGSWSSYLREWSYDTTNGLQLTLTIPEPSMFGLLAGLGALALAGTRRRRKKA